MWTGAEQPAPSSAIVANGEATGRIRWIITRAKLLTAPERVERRDEVAGAPSEIGNVL
jgi:hypothetical protein